MLNSPPSISVPEDLSTLEERGQFVVSAPPRVDQRMASRIVVRRSTNMEMLAAKFIVEERGKERGKERNNSGRGRG